MPKPCSFADVELDVEAKPRPRLARPDSETPFRILIAGDFTGGRAAGGPVGIDRDNFDDVLAKLRPELKLPGLTLRFTELDDFHPDRLFDQAEVFRSLRTKRAGLANPATFAATVPPSSPARPPLRPGKISFEDLLGDGESTTTERVRDDWQQLVHDLVAPHLVPAADPRQAEFIAQLDSNVSGAMRAVLHAPSFQALESAWRSVFFLARNLDTGASLKLYILDAPKESLNEALAKQTKRVPGAEPWSLLCANYYFDAGEADLETLARLAEIGRRAGAPVIAGAANGLLAGVTDVGWPALRRLPQAEWLGLAMPRFLLRLPYGNDTSPIEQFAFEEMPEHDHNGYLWGNAGIACAYLLGHAFSELGWDMRAGSVRDVDGLPLHVYRENGETKLKPCAEVLMTEEQAEALIEHGLMPLVTIKDRDVVRLLRFQSIADPPAPLAGTWE